MAFGRSMAFVFLSLLSLGAARESGTVTPVEKVIELLKKLQTKVEAEGKKEAAEYDKYACFCKEQADEKLYAIETSTKKIADLTASIDLLDTEITELNGQISDLSTLITELKANITSAEDERETEHKVYKIDAKDMADAISACERAIEAMKESKANMGGKTEMEAALVQVRKVAVLAMGTKLSAQKGALTQAQWGMLSDLVEKKQPGEAYEYQYHSNDIIATLESLLSQFQSNKEELDQTEFETNSAFEKKRLGLQNRKKFAEKEKAEKEADAERKTEQKNAKEEDRTQESQEKGSDQSFLDVLTAECETKAQLFDQRSKTRAAELTAMSEAMKALEDGVAPNFQANKKLNGLVQKGAKGIKAIPKGHWVYVEDAPAAKAASFLQLRGGRPNQGEKVRSFLMEAAQKLKSPVLSAVALKVVSAEDHFVKVRGIIKDLIQRLKDEAAAEATQKNFCDTNMAAAITSRDTEQAKIEDFTAQITGKEADKKTLEEEIAVLSKEIAENKKALNEATELRAEEEAENSKTIADAEAGKSAVEDAIEVLKNFYEPRAFIQYVPPNSDREGNTVADLAPETFDSEYNGAQESSKGIIGMLEVILSDFERTVSTVTTEESDAVGEFTTFKTNNEADTSLKEKSVTTKEGQITGIEDDLVTLEDKLKTAEEGHASAEAELESLHSMCVAGEESYAERVAKRNKEIEALKEAHGILENWQG